MLISIEYIIIFLSSFIVINGQLNCSIYNPCSQYGYCRDISDNETKCECKFWWNGTLCDEQTNSGKQVIALGCLVAFLIGLAYGLKIMRCIHNRKRKPKEIKKKEIKEDTKLLDIALKSARRSARLSSCLTAFLMIIFTSVALVSKWSLIQPIHNELVNKYDTNETLYYIQNPFCKTLNYKQFNVITFPAACFLILIFIIRTKRASFMKNKCYGYGAPPMPIDFISHIDRKFAAVVFAICADELLTIMQKALSRTSETRGEGVIVVYLLRLLDVFIMGFRYFPFLAAVYINSILTLTCATLYAWLDYSVTIVNQGMCQSDFYTTYENYKKDNTSNLDTYFDYYGTGPNLIIVQLCTDIPRYLCLAYINVKIPLLLINKIYNKFNKNISSEKRILMELTREQRILFRISCPNSVEMLYVRNLFFPLNRHLISRTLFGRLIPKKIYEWRDDFRFSSRIICIYSSIFLLLYFVAIQACVRVLPYLSTVQKFLQKVFDTISPLFIPTSNTDNDNEEINSNTSDFPFPSLVRPYLIAVFLTLFLIIIQLLVLLVNIRRNLFQTFRGDVSEIPRRKRSKYISLASGNIHFAGYFFGYLIWGFILIAVFSVIICICIESLIVFKSVRLLEKLLKRIIPSILFILFKQHLNRLLAQYVFLQHNGDVLALNNRRVLMIFMYFNIFLDAFLGFISSIARLIKSLIGGIIYMCRLDYSPLGRKLETKDGGFNAYCGFIHTESVHRHPVMLVFVSHLYTQLRMKQFLMEKYDLNIPLIEEKYRINLKNPSRYIRKWKLAVFLVRNPTFVFFRKAFLNQLHIDEIRALNDLDNDDDNNLQQRLYSYTRRMSATRPSIVSDNGLIHFNAQKF